VLDNPLTTETDQHVVAGAGARAARSPGCPPCRAYAADRPAGI